MVAAWILASKVESPAKKRYYIVVNFVTPKWHGKLVFAILTALHDEWRDKLMETNKGPRFIQI